MHYFYSAGMQTRGLVRPLFVAKTTWFGMPDFCNAEEECVGRGSKTMKRVTTMKYRWALGWWKSPCRVLSHLFQREYARWEVWVGWDSVIDGVRWEQNGGMLVWLGGNVLGCPLEIRFCGRQ